MNSFRAVERAIEYEIERQVRAARRRAARIVQETRLWDADREVTRSMRTKEDAHDYRYFPDPDLLPLDDRGRSGSSEIRATLPELPDARAPALRRASTGCPTYDAEVLTARKDLADYYEAAVRAHRNPKAISNWVMGDVLRVVRERKLDEALVIRDWPVPAEHLAALVRADRRRQDQRQDRQDGLRADARQRRRPAERSSRAQGLVQVTDEGAIEPIDRRGAARPTPTRSPSTAAARTSCSASSSAR